MSRVFRFLTKALAAFLTMAVLALGFLAWKMAAKPMESTELTPYVELAFEYLLPGGDARIKASTVTWDNHQHTLSVVCEETEVWSRRGRRLFSFPKVSLKLGVWSLLRGRLLPMELKADNAQFWATRRRNGTWLIGGAPVEEDGDGPSGIDIFDLLQEIGDEIADEDLVNDISIKEAVFRVHDRSLRKDWSVSAKEITLDHQKDKATGQAKIEVSQGETTATMNASYRFDRPQKRHFVDVAFQDIRPSAMASQHPKLAVLSAVDVPLSGHFSFGTDRFLNLSETKLELEGGKGTLKSEDLWNEPRPIEKLSLSLHYDEKKEQLELTKGLVDFGGTVLTAKGMAQTPPTQDLIWMRPRQDEAYEITINVANLPMDSFDALWPKPAIPNARSWIAENMKKGVFTKGSITLKGRIKWNNFEETELLTGEGKIAAEHGQITYMAGMPAVEDAAAEGVFDLKHMDVKILKGHTGDVQVQPFTLHMTGFAQSTQYITIPVRLTGPARSVLKLLDAKPLGYAKAIGLNPEDVGGKVEGVLTFHMPLLNDLLLEDIDYKAQATFKNFSLKNMIPDITLSDGTMAFRLNATGFELQGPVSLNGVPLTVEWSSRFDVSEREGEPLHQAIVNGQIGPAGWAAFGFETHAITTIGETPITVRYANVRDGFSTLDVQANFKDVELRSNLLSWHKEKGEAASLSAFLEIAKGEDIKVTSLSLEGKGVQIKGRATLEAGTKKLRQMTLDPYHLGRSQAVIALSNPQDLAAPVKVSVNGKALDVSGFSKMSEDDEPFVARLKEYVVDLGKLYTSAEGYMTEVKGSARRDKIGWKSLDFFGKAQDVTPVTISLKPEGKHLRFEVVSNDFGAALKGLGFTNTVKGGDLWIGGESTDQEPRLIRGKVKIGSFSVSGLPVLARLLSAVSPFGFVDLITGDAAFDHLRGHFRWDGEKIELSKVRAAGSVVGINLEGHVDLDTTEAALSGTLVPFSFVNSIIGSIPLIGDVITGGDGQGVIAAAFKVKGKLADPEVSVNPVSLLTPGFLRNLFFPGEDVKD